MHYISMQNRCSALKPWWYYWEKISSPLIFCSWKYSVTQHAMHTDRWDPALSIKANWKFIFSWLPSPIWHLALYLPILHYLLLDLGPFHFALFADIRFYICFSGETTQLQFFLWHRILRNILEADLFFAINFEVFYKENITLFYEFLFAYFLCLTDSSLCYWVADIYLYELVRLKNRHVLIVSVLLIFILHIFLLLVYGLIFVFISFFLFCSFYFLLYISFFLFRFFI